MIHVKSKALLVFVSWALATACGTTTSLSSRPATDGFGEPAPTDAASSLGGAGSASGGASTLTSGSGGNSGDIGSTIGGGTTGRLGAGTTAGTGGGVGGSRTTGSPATGSSAKAQTQPLLVGYRYVQDAAGFGSGLGIKGASTGDQSGYAKAVAKYINAHGGVGGRTLNVVVAGESAQDSISQPDTAEAAICAQFTQDNHVFAALSVLPSGESFQACLQKAGVPLVESNYNFWDPTNKNTNRAYFVPSNPDAPRSAPVLVDDLVKTGWFGSKPVIGLVAVDKKSRDRAFSAMDATLTAQGLKPASTYRISTPNSIQNAVLQFKAAGVTHVFYLEGSGGLETLFFMNAAESQQFHPKYALDTRSGADALRQNAPTTQLKGAAGVGWSPTMDLGSQGSSSQDALCLKIMRDQGLTTADSTARRYALYTCDNFFFFRATMERSAAASQSVFGFVSAVESLAASYVPYGSFEAWFGRNRHDGTSAFRRLLYDDSCSCFTYSGPLLRTG